MNSRIFIDSNIWLYAKLGTADIIKSERARNCLLNVGEAIISNQVLAEVGCNLIKKAKLDEFRVRLHLLDLLDACELVSINRDIVLAASHLRSNGTLSYWDSLIIAAALESGCSELWSEDLQAGRVFEGRLHIINPLT